MAKLIRFFLVFVTVLLIGGFVLFKLVSPSWVYDLPNGYKIRKMSNQNVVLGVEVDGDFLTDTVGISEYVGQFQYNDRYVGVKALSIDGENSELLFYLVDTLKQAVRGPFFDEASYLAATGVWTDTVLGDWITTTEVPMGARYQ